MLIICSVASHVSEVGCCHSCATFPSAHGACCLIQAVKTEHTHAVIAHQITQTAGIKLIRTSLSPHSTTSLQIVTGSEPGEYVIATFFKKDMRLVNTSLTTRPVAAPPLPLAFNASIHQVLVAGQADPAVGPVYSIEDLAVTLFNIARCGAACSLVAVGCSCCAVYIAGAVRAFSQAIGCGLLSIVWGHTMVHPRSHLRCASASAAAVNQGRLASLHATGCGMPLLV